MDGASKTSAEAGVSLIVAAAAAHDVDRAVARLDRADLARLGARTGDLLRLQHPHQPSRQTFARAMPAPSDQRGGGAIFLDGVQRDNAGVGLDERVLVTKADAAPARRLVARIESGAARMTPELGRRIHAALEATPAVMGDRLRIRLVGGRVLTGAVTVTEPAGPVIVTSDSALELSVPGERTTAGDAGDAYAGLGGLDEQIAKIREMIELPIRRPELFAELGLEPPKGVLFTGPPGAGKTLLARTVAKATDAHFFQVNGPEIVSKHYGDSEGRLREIFKKASAQSPSIIFIDEIDAIAPKRDDMAGDRQLERRIVAQLLTLLDGLSERRGVIVMAATNLPDSLDPALRRPGRFDREIAFGPPDRAGRAAILRAHTQNAPLAEDVDLDGLAARAHGFVGADLAALAREAGLAALRRLGDASEAAIDIRMADFEAALQEVRPSAVREVYTETPDVRWSDVGGAAAAKQMLVEAVIWPLRHADAHRALGLQPPKGVLLAGPPGCGKTHLARALATEAGVNFIAIRGAQLLTRHLGESERAVREVFAKARQSAPCIVFFDEIDAIGPKRSDALDPAAARVVATLLTEIDGVEELNGVFLLGATNRPDQIDDALLRPGRFDRLLRLDPPDAATRREILEIHTRYLPLADDVSTAALAEATTGLVGADLRALCQTAGREALRRWIADSAASPEAAVSSNTSAEASTATGVPSAPSSVPGLVVTAADFNNALAAQRESDQLRGHATSAAFA